MRVSGLILVAVAVTALCGQLVELHCLCALSNAVGPMAAINVPEAVGCAISGAGLVLFGRA